jgi:hypothetical protein
MVDHQNGLGKNSELIGGPTVPNVFIGNNCFIELVVTTSIVSLALNVPTAVIPK